MKISKLLVLTALWLTASSAMAAIVDGVRQMPVPSATQGFVASESTDAYYYLYNVDAQKFFTEGNAWGTQASVGSTGLKVAFIPDGDYPAAYLFNDYAVSKSAWKYVFFDNENQMFVDLGSQLNYRWGVEENGNTFRLYAASEENGNPGWEDTTDEDGNTVAHPAYRAGLYVGWDAASTSTAMVPYLAEGEGHCINWAFVTKDVYAAYEAEIGVYQAAEALKAAYEDVKAKGFTDIAAYEALYANEAATKAELEAAVTALNEAFVEWGKGHASVENPADMTSMIVNPHFDNGDATTGWSGDAFGRGGTVSDGAEHYNKNYDTYQTIKGLPAGVYAVGVNAYYRTGDYGGTAENHWLNNDAASKYAKLYAKVGDNTYEMSIANVMSGAQAENQNQGDIEVSYTDPETEEVKTVYVPNTMATADYYFHTLNQYANKLLVAVDESGELTIGVKKTSQVGNDWSMFDDFSLTYYGTGADAAELFLNESLKNYGDVEIEEGQIYTEFYLDEYNAVLNAQHSASSLEEVTVQLNAIDGAYKALMNNIELWNTWKAKVVEGSTYVANPIYENLPAIGDLGDYTEFDAEVIEEERALTNEELETEIKKIEDMINEVQRQAKGDIKPGDDVTRFMKNPGFDDDKDIDYSQAEGWTYVKNHNSGNFVRGPLGQGNKDLMEQALGYMNYCFESWHCHDFDLYQEVGGLPAGVYEISVQGYVRCEASGYTRGDLESPLLKNVPIWVYINNSLNSFPDVYSEQRDGWEYTTVEDWTVETINDYDYPNSMGGAAQCFAHDMYKKSAFGLIKEDGEVFRVGVKGKMDTDWWVIWDNFKLTYRGFDPEYVKPALEDALLTINLDQAMGEDVYAKAVALQTAAQEAIASNDGEAMFKVLSDIYDVADEIRESVEMFAQLETALGDLNGAISASKADQATKDAANTLAGTIAGGLENHTLANADVTDLRAQVDEMITKLGIPADYPEASDENPKTFLVIKNPSYDEGVSGWNGDAAAWSGDGLNAEIFGKDFDYYQDIVGLPAGTYQVNVQGFYRAGSAANDYASWTEAPDEDNNAFIYGASILNGDTIVSSKPMARLASGAGADFYGAEGFVTVQEATDDEAGLAVANTMTAASYDFEIGKYMNAGPIVKLAEGATLRIGLKKTTNLTDNWTLWDNWTLLYFGANSSKVADEDASGIRELDNAPALSVEFFTLDGRKANAAQKGIMIQKTTLGNGAIIVRKVRK